MRFSSMFHFLKSFTVLQSAMLCQVFAWLAMVATLVFGNGTDFDYHYDEQPEIEMQITQDGRMVMSELPELNGNRSYSEQQSFQFAPSTISTQTPYYSFTRSENQTVNDGIGAPKQNINATDGRRPGMFQGATVGVSYLPGWGNHGLEMTQMRVSASFGLPAPMKNSFFLLTPSFEPTFVNWSGPQPFPDTLYSASLGCMLIKKLNDRWSAIASVGPRWSSDGKETQNAVRCSLMGGMTWNKSAQWQFRFGVVYADRDDSFNVLPFGGLIWTPNEDWKYELMAPMLRVSRRCNDFQSILPRQSDSTYWRYAGIGFGGGTWAFQSVNRQPDVANYTEFSVVFGLESERKKRSAWRTEIGYVFGRSMKFKNDTMHRFHIGDTIVLRGTLAI